MSDGYDDEMEHVFDWVTRPDLRSDQAGDRPLQPLCRECLRDSPVGEGDLCEFCIVIMESEL